MLELIPRADLAQLSETALADRLAKARDADDRERKRWGWLYTLNLFRWSPRLVVQDPRDYRYPAHIRGEIRDILREFENRGLEPPGSSPDPGIQ